MPPVPVLRRIGLAVASVAVVAASVISPVSAERAAAATTTWLPFDMASTSSLRSSGKKVFANWVPTLPISLDNKAPAGDYYQKNYLTPTGEGGKHAAYGGFLRDRPLGRAPLAGADWRLQDMKTEVRSAIAAGIDGFTVVIYSFPAAGGTTTQWTNLRLMMQAAAEVDSGFKIIPMPDMTSGSVASASVATMSSRLAELGKFSSIYKIGGKMVLSPFTSERKAVSWWSSLLSSMANSHATPVTFWPLFQDEQTYGPQFSAISYGMANWGNRDPAYNNPNITYSTGPIGRVTKVHNRGDKWMQPVSVQDERPREGRYFEAANTENFRNTWEVARKTNSEYAQLTTWNDLPEGSGMEPSSKHGYTFLDLNAYYISWFKTGVQPKITRNAIYLTHRKQKIGAKATFPQTKWMTNLDGGTAARDTVEALTFSKAAGTVQISVGGKVTSCAVTAGINTCKAPLQPGTVSAKLIQGSTTVATLTSPYAVSASPYVQDFEYTGSSSLRSGTSAAVAAPPAPTGSTVSLAPTADSFVDQGTPTENHGSGGSLLVDGSSTKISYLRFALPAAPSGKTLVGATLRLRTTAEEFAGSPGTFTVQVAGNGWEEKTVTWSNRPALTAGSIGSLKTPAKNTAYTSTLTAAALKGSVGQQVTLAVAGSHADGIFVDSKDNPVVGDRPQLTLTFQ